MTTNEPIKVWYSTPNGRINCTETTPFSTAVDGIKMVWIGRRVCTLGGNTPEVFLTFREAQLAAMARANAIAQQHRELMEKAMRRFEAISRLQEPTSCVKKF